MCKIFWLLLVLALASKNKQSLDRGTFSLSFFDRLWLRLSKRENGGCSFEDNSKSASIQLLFPVTLAKEKESTLWYKTDHSSVPTTVFATINYPIIYDCCFLFCSWCHILAFTILVKIGLKQFHRKVLMHQNAWNTRNTIWMQFTRPENRIGTPNFPDPENSGNLTNFPTPKFEDFSQIPQIVFWTILH